MNDRLSQNCFRSLRTADVSPRSSPLRDDERGETSAIRRLLFPSKCYHQISKTKSLVKMKDVKTVFDHN